jgi:hypothetical protein
LIAQFLPIALLNSLLDDGLLHDWPIVTGDWLREWDLFEHTLNIADW